MATWRSKETGYARMADSVCDWDDRVGSLARYEELLVGPIERFDQKHTMFSRALLDPVWAERSKVLYTPTSAQHRAVYAQEDYALRVAAGYVKKVFSMGRETSSMPRMVLQEYIGAENDRTRPGTVWVSDPAEASGKVKAAARFFGASLVGICRLDRRWIYSDIIDEISREHISFEVPEGLDYAVVVALEMSRMHIECSPTYVASAATHLGYSKMAFVSASVAEFIRQLGYEAMPSANDSALSIPLAVEAGLGELGRNGLLITPEFGPRIRLCKVFTDLPLVPHEPLFFGVTEFCQRCGKCARECPPRAISSGNRTTEPLNMHNNPGALKWPVNAEQCFKWWIANRGGCANCIRVCPYNKEDGWIHDLARATVRTAPWLIPLFVRLDDILRYGRQRDPNTTWIPDGAR